MGIHLYIAHKYKAFDASTSFLGLYPKEIILNSKIIL